MSAHRHGDVIQKGHSQMDCIPFGLAMTRFDVVPRDQSYFQSNKPEPVQRLTDPRPGTRAEKSFALMHMYVLEKALKMSHHDVTLPRGCSSSNNQPWRTTHCLWCHKRVQYPKTSITITRWLAWDRSVRSTAAAAGSAEKKTQILCEAAECSCCKQALWGIRTLVPR